MNQIADNLWILRYPLTELGVDIGRVVTLIRLGNGELIIHSTAPFSPQDVAAISEMGRPAYLVEATNAHDTFAKEGRAAFPNAAFLAPEGFSEMVGFPTLSFEPPPAAWGDEVAVLKLAGKVEKMREFAMLHRPSRTLIICDVAFHFTESASLGQRIFASAALVGGKDRDTAMPRLEKSAVEDKAAFTRSLETMFAWDFERVIVGHGNVVETTKNELTSALRTAGFLPPV